MATVRTEKVVPESKRELTEREKRRQERKGRNPFARARSKLQLSPELRGYFDSRDEHWRWFNDNDDSIQLALSRDWRHVTVDEVPVGGIGSYRDPNTVEDLGGAKVSRVVGKDEYGNKITGYLMAIPKEYWEDDQRDKMEVIDQRVSAITSGKDPDGNRLIDESRYVPRTGIKVKTTDAEGKVVQD